MWEKKKKQQENSGKEKSWMKLVISNKEKESSAVPRNPN